MPYLWIALGSALGGCARHAFSQPAMPWAGTLAVNVLGCLLIGFLAASLESQPWRQFLIAGFCGGFTTFSSFSLETLAMIRDGHPGKAAAYVAASVLVCLAAAGAGYAVKAR